MAAGRVVDIYLLITSTPAAPFVRSFRCFRHCIVLKSKGIPFPPTYQVIATAVCHIHVTHQRKRYCCTEYLVPGIVYSYQITLFWVYHMAVVNMVMVTEPELIPFLCHTFFCPPKGRKAFTPGWGGLSVVPPPPPAAATKPTPVLSGLPASRCYLCTIVPFPLSLRPDIMHSRIVGVCLSGYAYGLRTCSAFAFPLVAKCGVIKHAAAETSTRARVHQVHHHVARGGGGEGRGGVGRHGRGCPLPSSTAAGDVEVEMGQVTFWSRWV